MEKSNHTAEKQLGKTIFPIFCALLIAVAAAVGPLFVKGKEVVHSSSIRIINASGVDLENVIVGGKSYGNIKQGESTSYKTWDIAYSYSSVSVYATGKRYQIIPEDYVGETPLGSGKFAYILSFNKENKIKINVQHDER